MMTFIKAKLCSLSLCVLTLCLMSACDDGDQGGEATPASAAAPEGEEAAGRDASMPASPGSENAQADQAVGIDGGLSGRQPEAANETELNFMSLSETGDVVSFVEISRYMGRWYEIATTPSFQQRACFNTEADYSFNQDEGWVDVTNRCSAGGPDGRQQELQGRAELVDMDTQAKFDVIFFNQRAPYWVVALDGAEGEQPYAWAVVSVPGGRTMWILSRSPTITERQRAEINAHLADRGFPIETLIDTFQEAYGE